MTDLATWLGVVVAMAGLVVAYATYRSGRNRLKLDYVLQALMPLASPAVTGSVQLLVDGIVTSDPALTVLRIANTGDRAIPATSIEAAIGFRLLGVRSIARAEFTASRPFDLRPIIVVEDDTITLEARLLNPGDLLVLQVLSSGAPSEIMPVGRVEDLHKITRVSLPYPPGSGSEGEMRRFDQFMWFGFMPVVILLLIVGVPLLFRAEGWALVAWAAAGASGVFAHLANTRRLIRRRRLWRP